MKSNSGQILTPFAPASNGETHNDGDETVVEIRHLKSSGWWIKVGDRWFRDPNLDPSLYEAWRDAVRRSLRRWRKFKDGHPHLGSSVSKERSEQS
jgi:hypothetical protein